ncbi:MAG: cytochrome-c peroxidase [Bacteroidetes bacterium]|nr:cytochrome-c peroxidase [Bacteroidota bacterium]
MNRRVLYIFTGIILLISLGNKPGQSPYAFPGLLFFPKMPIDKSNPVTKEGALLGRYLFYDSSLSSDSSFSCGSCHKQEYAFSDSPNRFSSGRTGEKMLRNTPALYNLAWYPTLFWDGRASSIENQISFPLHAVNEMDIDWTRAINRIKQNSAYNHLFENAFDSHEIDSTKIIKAIGQFVRTLLSYQSKYDSAIIKNAHFTRDEYAGFVIITDQTKGDCMHCHPTDGNSLMTTTRFSNNGLDAIDDLNNYSDKGLGAITGNPKQNGWFKIPSLRNVALTAPYMHDGRFATLEEVMNFYSDSVHNVSNIDPKMELATRHGANLTATEPRQVIAFLNTMTDSAFITNSEFSNPFLPKK